MLAVAPVVMGAQTAPQQSKPAPQAAPPATAQTSGAAPAAKAAPAANSQRFVTTENFYRPSAKPQPGSSAPSPATPAASAPTVSRPAAKPVAIKPNTAPVLPRPATPPAAPVVAPAAIAAPRPIALQPAVIATPAPTSGVATPAAVDYAAGKLTVVADNAPLGFVLNLIAAKTGAVIDLVPELQNEPVVARLGPASVRDVMSSLLDSPRIDYIVLGAGDETGALQRVVVRMRHSFGLYAMSAPRAPQPRQEDTEEEKLDQNGHLVSSGRTEADPQLSQQQRIENWQKTREAMRIAEMKQQAQERENEKNASPDPPAPPQDQPADPPQNQSENPPQL